MREYLDFDLEIREGGPETYPMSVDSPGGQALEEMRFPFDDSELENKLLALENALLRSGGSHRGISPEEQTVQEFGERLFKAVLTGDVKTRYEVSLREARQQNKGLRLKLRIKPPKLAVLPWEFLYNPDSGEYLCFSSNTPLVRYVDLRQPVEQMSVTPPLRILGMVASPTDLPQLDVENEKRLVEKAIKVLREKGLVELTWLEEQTWSALHEAMWDGPWHIFHFVGHGDFDRNNSEGRVAFSDEAGRKAVLPAKKLARLLDEHPDLRLAFLNSCEGARGGEGDPFSGTAATLVRRGVPAVVAMQYQITDKAAIEFSRAFYHAVASNLPVDAAVAAARTAVSMYDTLEWGTPVLYMRSPDGYLFDIKKEGGEEDTALRRYRKAVQTFWTSGELHEREVQKLKDIAENELGLDPTTTADIEREVMGETKEAILERRWQAAKEQYRKAVEAAWADNEVSDAEAEQLRALAIKLDLSTDTAAKIEREVMGDTVQVIVQRQRHLEELYAHARRLHQNREWQAVITVFEQIHSEEPEYRDREGLLQSAHEALEQEQADRTERAPPQLPALAGSWLALALRGLVMAIFGLVLLFFYDTGDFRLYGALMIIADGVCATIDATTRAGRRRPLLIQGRISGLVGLFILFVWLVRDISILSSISASAQTFLDGLFDELAIAPRLVGTWAIFIGIIRIIAAIQLRWDTKNLLLMGTSGVLLVIFGILLLPKQPSGQPYPWSLFGFLVLASGITLMIFAFRVGWPRFRRVIRVK